LQKYILINNKSYVSPPSPIISADLMNVSKNKVICYVEIECLIEF